MAKPQSIATVKYEKSQGIIAKSFKMKKELAEEFKATCERIGVGQAATITSLMKDFIEKIKIKSRETATLRDAGFHRLQTLKKTVFQNNTIVSF